MIKRASSPEVELDVLIKYVKELGHISTLQLSGGEPFLYKDLATLTEAYITYNHCRRVTVITNGSLPQETIKFTKRILGFNKDLRLLLHISIDDYVEQHARTRGISDLPSKIETLVEALHALNHPRLEINGNLCIHRGNQKRIPKIKEYIRDTFPFKNIICTLQRDEKNRVIDFDVSTLLATAKTFKEYSQYKQLHRATQSIKQVPCLAGLIGTTLMPDGSIHPCELTPAWFRIVKGSHPRTLWRNSPRRNQSLKALSQCHCSLECQLSFNVFHAPTQWIPLSLSYLAFSGQRLIQRAATR